MKLSTTHMFRTRTLLARLLGTVALAAAVPARAEILVTMTRPNNAFYGFGAAGQLVPLTPNGTTQTPASTSRPVAALSSASLPSAPTTLTTTRAG
jgi:hypothetical protein